MVRRVINIKKKETMKKYFLKNSDQELQIGQRVLVQKPMQTPFGMGTVQAEVVITQATLELLEKEGVVEVRDDFDVKAYVEKLKPYVRRIARKMKVDLPEASSFLQSLLSLSPKAHFTLLAEVIAEVKNRGLERGPKVYWFNPAANYMIEVIDHPNSAAAFYSVKDALDAYKLLFPFIRELVADGE